jgi:hypothetical protein
MKFIKMSPDKRDLFLCGALQSSGSTLVSWCFLQRADMDGILDSRGDILPTMPRDLQAPFLWYKATISSFRMMERKLFYEDEGWRIHPLLVVRDVRTAFNSLLTKPYGQDGITAEEPPLRLRLVRFKQDWEECRSRGWPIIRFESLITRPEDTLRRACALLSLPWDPNMLTWPKRLQDICCPLYGNETFIQSRSGTLQDTIRPETANCRAERILPADLAWIEKEFAEYNSILDYPEHLDPHTLQQDGARSFPLFEKTKRYQQLRRKNYLWWLLRSVPYCERRWQEALRTAMGLK